MRQTIASLFLDEIGELNKKGGRVVQVISHGLEYRRKFIDGAWTEKTEECYLCLVEEKEEGER